ncbi:TonB family protein [Chitinophaga skermanii]|uniref:TonB family protein n=1 Tax=Chitinophaga skermanii TaxID=331697 RepID=A0A327QDH5_9BACT|nr:energy transducer TonB [Chitinophaga skermanii]RAJ02530.1 TonB family protein [Chitinophaga skermanii]
MRIPFLIPAALGIVLATSALHVQAKDASYGVFVTQDTTVTPAQPFKEDPVVLDQYLKLRAEDSVAQAYTTLKNLPPRYPAGKEALNAYLKAHAIRTKEARKADIKGKVGILFVVKADGEIRDIQVYGKSLGYGLDDVAIDMVRKMPRWLPAIEDGKAINVLTHIPIEFK